MKPFTLRELEVIDLVAEGWDNKTISGRLYVSTKTLEMHLSHITDKLGYVPGWGLMSRVIIARWAWQHRPRRRETNT